jgi:hypothetical protein
MLDSRNCGASSLIAKRSVVARAACGASLCASAMLGATAALAQDSLCAQVKIEIQQEATLERQVFDAEMKFANGLDTSALENVGINVTFQDEAGTPAVRRSIGR